MTTRNRSVIGAPIASSGAATIVISRCWTMCAEKSVVSYVAIGEERATNSTAAPEYQAHGRQRGTGLCGWARSTWRTAHA